MAAQSDDTTDWLKASAVMLEADKIASGTSPLGHIRTFHDYPPNVRFGCKADVNH